MNPNFAISVLTVKGQFVIGNSRGENALYSHPKNVSKIYAALHTDLAW